MDNIFTVAKPFILISNFFGLFPMSFDGAPRKGFFKTKWHNVALCFAFLALLIFFSSLNIYYKAFALSDSMILTEAWSISVNLDFFSNIFLFVYQICQNKKIERFLWKLQTADFEVNLHENRLSLFKFSPISGKF